jgi:hypothetical protein
MMTDAIVMATRASEDNQVRGSPFSSFAPRSVDSRLSVARVLHSPLVAKYPDANHDGRVRQVLVNSSDGSRVYSSSKAQNFYIADAEAFTLLIDHGVSTGDASLSGEARSDWGEARLMRVLSLDCQSRSRQGQLWSDEMVGCGCRSMEHRKLYLTHSDANTALCQNDASATTTLAGTTRAASSPCYITVSPPRPSTLLPVGRLFSNRADAPTAPDRERHGLPPAVHLPAGLGHNPGETRIVSREVKKCPRRL